MSLKPALITSFDIRPRGIASPDRADLAWVDKRLSSVAPDFYLMMESEVSRWVAHFGLNIPSVSAFEFLAALGPSQIDEMAAILRDKALEIADEVAALTTFLPEINFRSGDRSRDQKCIAALCNLGRLAMQLKMRDRVPVIQLVAGSLITRFDFQNEKHHPNVLYAYQEGEAELFDTILDRLCEILNFISADGSDISKLRFAFELEPGPIYLLRNVDTLELFASKIQSHDCELVRRCVGFNLDVAHWWLADKITPQWLQYRASHDLRQRIFHAHISGHSERGHFGDYSLAKIPKPQHNQFVEWLAAIKTLPNVDYVSLEYEAAPSFNDVNESVGELLKMLRMI